MSDPDPTEVAGYVGAWPERFVPELMAGRLVEAHHVARYRWASAAVRGRRVLDAGCGVGYGSAILSEAGAASVVGVDLSPGALEAARAAVGASARFEQADLRRLPFEPESFDVVVCLEAIEHIERPEEAVAELARVLAPEGVAVVSSPNAGIYEAGNPHHEREFTPSEFRELLGARFSAVELFRQSEWAGSAIFDDETFVAAGDLRPGEVPDRKLVDQELGSERFLLAIASNGPLPPMGRTLVMTRPEPPRRPPPDRAAAALKRRVSQLEQEVERLREARRQALSERDRAVAALRRDGPARHARRGMVALVSGARARVRARVSRRWRAR